MDLHMYAELLQFVTLTIDAATSLAEFAMALFALAVSVKATRSKTKN